MNDSDIQHQLKTLHLHWEIIREGSAMTHTFVFRDFIEAMQLVNHVADYAQEIDHHPDIFISYNKVTITLTTHATGGISEKDILLAKKIETLDTGEKEPLQQLP